MSTVINFNGRRVIEPGVYAQTRSNVSTIPTAFPFGDVVIIDTGSGASWGGGSGINGELSQGLESVYSFDNPNDFRSFVKGGQIWDTSDFIFNPLSGASAPSSVYVVRAAQTAAARITFSLTNGSVSFISKNEGLVGNGVLDETLAVSTVTLDNTQVASGVTLVLGITDGDSNPSILPSTASTGTSPAEFKTLIVSTINGGTHGYTAKLQGEIINIFPPVGTGVSANTYTITASGTITGTTTTDFSGGITGTKIVKGLGANIKVSDTDSAQYVIEFLQGSHNGNTDGGTDLGGTAIRDTNPDLIALSSNFTDIDGLVAWATNDINFNRSFQLDPNYTITSGGGIVIGDVNAAINVASGGTENYRAQDLDKVLQDIRELGNTYFLCDRFGAEARGVENMKILNHIQNDAEFDKFMVVGGGIDGTKFKTDEDSSIEIAKFYDSSRVIVVHSGHYRTNINTGEQERLPAVYHAANVVGRLGGLEPQEPITFKALRINNFVHNLNQSEREEALQSGVLHNRTVAGIGSVINQGINTLQNNLQEINTDGTSFEISIMNIAAQLNKELILNMRPIFVGGNRGRITSADVQSFVEGYLLSRTALDNVNNYIIRYEQVTVTLSQGSYNITYRYVPNGPINKLFVTGFMLDTNL